MDENGMGKSHTDWHRIPYKPTVYHFGRKNGNWKKGEKIAVTGAETGKVFS
jgi:hypothetical protein